MGLKSRRYDCPFERRRDKQLSFRAGYTTVISSRRRDKQLSFRAGYTTVISSRRREILSFTSPSSEGREWGCRVPMPKPPSHPPARGGRLALLPRVRGGEGRRP